MSEAVILDAVRTPFGRRGGAVREVRPDRLLANTLRALVDRPGIAADIERIN
jgi:acetyl-CoA acetyltransferase